LKKKNTPLYELTLFYKTEEERDIVLRKIVGTQWWNFTCEQCKYSTGETCTHPNAKRFQMSFEDNACDLFEDID